MNEPSSYPPEAPELPIAISRLASRYYLYSAPIVAWLRLHHQLNGVLCGTLPQSPQQNVFLGLPLELMPEEVALLVAKKLAIVVDDVVAHRRGIAEMDGRARAEYMDMWRAAGRRDADAAKQAAKQRANAALSKLQGEKREKAERAMGIKQGMQHTRDSSVPGQDTTIEARVAGLGLEDDADDDDQLFPAYAQAAIPPRDPMSSAGTENATLDALPSVTRSGTIVEAAHIVTPTLSDPRYIRRLSILSTLNTLPSQGSPAQAQFPSGDIVVPPTYPLYVHLSALGYFLSPGLRFGCTYMAYPGDPLRYHSHFLVVGYDWDEEMDLVTLVGGGRLGTGVKKGFLLGGRELAADSRRLTEPTESDASFSEDVVRCFCVEWAGM